MHHGRSGGLRFSVDLYDNESEVVPYTFSRAGGFPALSRAGRVRRTDYDPKQSTTIDRELQSVRTRD